MSGFLEKGVIAFNSLLLLRRYPRSPFSLAPSLVSRNRSLTTAKHLASIATSTFRSTMPGVESQGVEWPADRVRDTFIQFFKEEKNHENWKSSPVVPHNDPTLLFANAGSSTLLHSIANLRLGSAELPDFCSAHSSFIDSVLKYIVVWIQVVFFLVVLGFSWGVLTDGIWEC